jgi:hypothetical protein
LTVFLEGPSGSQQSTGEHRGPPYDPEIVRFSMTGSSTKFKLV